MTEDSFSLQKQELFRIAFQRGVNAHIYGHPFADNDFYPSDPRFGQWVDGWLASEKMGKSKGAIK